MTQTSGMELPAVFGVIAIELPAATRPAPYFERSAAAAIGAALGRELERHLHGPAGLGLSWMAAHYDAAEVLRPGFPIHRALVELYRAGVRDPWAEPQLLTLAARSAQAPVPALAPDPELDGAALRVVPFAVLGASERIDQARSILEHVLFEQGLVDARLALMLRDALALELPHVRLMTLHDLAALCAVQLEHEGLETAWAQIETALFSPERTEQGALGALRLSGRGGVVTVTLPDPEAETGAPDPSALDWATGVYQVRRLAAVCTAHGLALELAPPQRAAPTEMLEGSGWIAWHGPVRRVASVVLYTAPGLGVVAAELRDAERRRVGTAHLLLAPALGALARRVGLELGTAPRVALDTAIRSDAQHPPS